MHTLTSTSIHPGFVPAHGNSLVPNTEPAGQLELAERRLLTHSPDTNQRELAMALRLRLWEDPHLPEGPVDRGWVSASTFTRNDHKLAYPCALASSRLWEKRAMRRDFVAQNEPDFERLQARDMGGAGDSAEVPIGPPERRGLYGTTAALASPRGPTWT